MAIVYLGLGSNLGDRRKNLESAVGMLNANGVSVLKTSTIIETDPVGGPKQGKYLNAVLKINTTLFVEDLHTITQAVEHKLGRTREVLNGPRTIDIDILLYDDIKLVSKKLIVPHPRMFEREFVMKPLKQIDPRICASFEL